jgi:hypothetical protein
MDRCLRTAEVHDRNRRFVAIEGVERGAERFRDPFSVTWPSAAKVGSYSFRLARDPEVKLSKSSVRQGDYSATFLDLIYR